MKSVIIFLKIIQAAAAICSLVILLNDCRQHAFSSGTTESNPLHSSFRTSAYNSNYNLAEKYTTPHHP